MKCSCLFWLKWSWPWLPSANVEYCGCAFRRKCETKIHFIIVSYAAAFTLWILVIEIETVACSLVAGTPSIIASLFWGAQSWCSDWNCKLVKDLIKTSGCLVWCASGFFPTAHSLPCMSMRWDVTNASVFVSRVRRDRKGRSDRISDCQNWQDINLENAMNEIEAIETSMEVVDGQQKVDYICLMMTDTSLL